MPNWYQTQNKNWFVNPYNFVSLRGVERKRIEEWRGSETDRVAGSIHCTLTTKTPLALPDHAPSDPSRIKAEDVTGGQHFSYPFMSVDGATPIIPGSEIRGMVRSVYEAVTKSCLGILDDSLLTGRSYDVKTPGILHNCKGKWSLYNGRQTPIKTFNDSEFGFFVSTENGVRYLNTEDGEIIPNLSRVYYQTVQVVTYNRQGSGVRTNYVNKICLYDPKGSKSGWSDGYLIIGEIGVKGNKNRHCSHVISHNRELVCDVSQEDIDNLKSVLSFYSNEKLNTALDGVNHTGYVGYDPEISKTLPVFYERVNGKLHLAPAIYSREVYYKTIDEIAGRYVSCARITDAEHDAVCPACALFGVVRENEKHGRSYGSAVRFSDALPSKYELYPDYTTLKELSGPKISSAEFYLSTPRIRGGIPRTWNYEYARVRKQNTRNGIDRFVHSAQIRGRKFYFHWSKVVPENYTSAEKTVRNTSVQLLKSGTFAFDVFFDGVSRKQLSELLWSLSPRDPKEPKAVFCHKIGTGKSLGLGSVEIRVTSAEIRSYDINTGEYRTEPVSMTDETTEIMTGVSHDLLYMLKFDVDRAWSTGYPVNMEDGTSGGISYPIGDNGDRNDENRSASYQWFIGNKQVTTGSSDDGKGTDPKYSQTLPVPAEVSKPGIRLRILEKH